MMKKSVLPVSVFCFCIGSGLPAQNTFPPLEKDPGYCLKRSRVFSGGFGLAQAFSGEDLERAGFRILVNWAQRIPRGIRCQQGRAQRGETIQLRGVSSVPWGCDRRLISMNSLLGKGNPQGTTFSTHRLERVEVPEVPGNVLRSGFEGKPKLFYPNRTPNFFGKS
ncbi:MAG: hypothetical protein CM15mP74_00160 [Halieaceae bacterium]|nr:MAG: hypothetical protein CM15mP74_00160 [Halieaceae bacterium]